MNGLIDLALEFTSLLHCTGTAGTTVGAWTLYYHLSDVSGEMCSQHFRVCRDSTVVVQRIYETRRRRSISAEERLAALG